jgi:hypothetical protein
VGRIIRVVVGLLLALGLVGIAGPATAAPAYGPWSSEVAGLQARVSQPDRQYARVFVQFRRSASSTDGDRQVRISYRAQGADHTTTVAAESLAPGQSTRFGTSKIPCGHSIQVNAMARKRADGGAWSPWYSVGANLTRSC